MNFTPDHYSSLQILIMKKTFLFISFSSLVIIACNNAGKDSVEQADSANREARKDTMTTAPVPDANTSAFLVDATNGGMAEVQLSRIAVERSTNAAVKNFANLMINDHTSANDQMMALAAKKNVALPSDVSDENRKKSDELMKKSAKDFDKEYVDMMVKDHEAAVNLFERASNNVSDAEVVSFINNILPKLRSHLESVKALKKSLK
jgi:putative membrane protein